MWYRRLRCALVWFGGESGISRPSVLAGSARATMRSASGLVGGRGVSRLSSRGRLGGSAAGIAGKCTSGSQSSGVGAGAIGIRGLSGVASELLALEYGLYDPANECRSDVELDALDTLPLLEHAERYPLGVLAEDMRFMSDGGVGVGRTGIWKCSACGAEIDGLVRTRKAEAEEREPRWCMVGAGETILGDMAGSEKSFARRTRGGRRGADGLGEGESLVTLSDRSASMLGGTRKVARRGRNDGADGGGAGAGRQAGLSGLGSVSRYF